MFISDWESYFNNGGFLEGIGINYFVRDLVSDGNYWDWVEECVGNFRYEVGGIRIGGGDVYVYVFRRVCVVFGGEDIVLFVVGENVWGMGRWVWGLEEIKREIRRCNV